MNREHIPDAIRLLIFERAAERCEYCHMHQQYSPFTHQIDHIIPLKHGGLTVESNLALACIRCNRNKGSDIATFDPVSGDVTRLYDPRTQRWNDHFEWEGAIIIGKTSIGRATIILLQMNDGEQLLRRQLIRALEG